MRKLERERKVNLVMQEGKKGEPGNSPDEMEKKSRVFLYCGRQVLIWIVQS